MSRVTLCLTNKCNLRCKYCFSRKSKKDEYLSYNVVYAFLSKFNEEDKIEEITLTGGEPFLHSKIEAFLTMSNKFAGNIIVLSNGTIFDKDIFEILNKYHIDLHISLDSIDTKYHNKYRGKHGIIIENIRSIKQKYNNIKININVAISPLNISEIPKIETWVKEMGITSDYSLLVTNSLVLECSWSMASAETVDIMISKLNEWADNEHKILKVKFYEYILKQPNVNLKDCFYCKRNIIVFSNGEVYACFNNKKLCFGNLYIDTIEEVLLKYKSMNTNYNFQNCFSNKCIGTYI